MKETSHWFVLYRLSVISHVLSGGSPAQILNCLGAHSVRVSSEQSDLKIRLLSALIKSPIMFALCYKNTNETFQFPKYSFFDIMITLKERLKLNKK